LKQINRIITIKGHDEKYTVGKSKLRLEGKTIAELQKIRDGVNEKKGNPTSIETTGAGEAEPKTYTPTQK